MIIKLKSLIKEIVDKNSILYLGWVNKTNMKVIGFSVESGEDETHHNYMLGLPYEWRTESDSNLIRWRYRRDINSVYWWEFNKPTEEEKQSVENWIGDNLKIKHPTHKIIPTDKNNMNFYMSHGEDTINESKQHLTLYHGTNNNTFDNLLRFPQNPSHILPFGIHLADNIDVANKYGKFILSVEVVFNKLYDATGIPDKLAIEIAGRKYRPGMTSAEALDAGGRGAWNTTHAENMLERYGYDGIIYKDKSGSNNYIAFRPDQVKIINRNI